MSTNPTDAPPRVGRSRIGATVRALIRTRLTAGLITILPIVITVWLIRVVFGWLRDASLWVVDAFLLSSWGRGALERWGVHEEDIAANGLDALPRAMQWGIGVFAVFLTIFLLYVIGMFTANVIGKRLLESVEVVVYRLPFVKTIYHTLKQILGLFSGDQMKSLQRVALVPFPNQVTRSIGFITNTFTDSVTGEELCAAFIATTPNPTTGYVFVVRRADIMEVDWTAEEAIKAIISGGIISPEYVTMSTGTQHPSAAGPAPGKPPG